MNNKSWLGEFISNSSITKKWILLSPIKKSIIVGIATIVGYLSVVVATTPALPPFSAINAAFQLNAVIIFGIAIGVGLQIFLTDKSKELGCKIKGTTKGFGGNSGSTAATSFFSFFSLVPLGCCGWWLYVISLLPSIFGSTLSGVLIEYSQPLAYVGLAIIFGFNAATYFKFKKEKKLRESISK